MATTSIGFRPTPDDERIISRATQDGESTTDVIRRALRLLGRQQWREQLWADQRRLADEDLSTEPDAW